MYCMVSIVPGAGNTKMKKKRCLPSRNQCNREKTFKGDGCGEGGGGGEGAENEESQEEVLPQKNHISLGKESQECWYRLNGLET